MSSSPPSGEVVFVFTDIVSSTRLWDEAAEMAEALRRHDELLTSTFRSRGGHVFSATGDGFGVAFREPGAAVLASVDVQRALRDATWPKDAKIVARIGVHAGAAVERDDNYFGPTVNRTARLMSIADGQEVLVSGDVVERLSAPLPDGVELVPLGSLALKDIADPVDVYSVAAEGVAVARPPAPARTREVGNLPRPSTELVGRESAVADAVAALGSSRVVSLVGPGGVGKTTLALHVARRLTGFTDGCWLVRLGSVEDGAGVLPALNAALGQSVVTAGLDQVIAESIRDRRLLVLFDNCEHVIGEVVRIVDEIVAGTPNVSILATSREPLHVAGERVLPVLPLPSADPESPAVMLFVRRATELGAELSPDDFPTIGRICRRLDGLPLAIELAAAKARMFSPERLLELLDDRFRLLQTSRSAELRHRTLRDTFEWSYEMLEEQQRQILDRLGVFTARFDIDDAVAVCADDVISAPDVIDAVVSLVDKSLVSSTRSTPPYELLESIRELAREQLQSRVDATPTGELHARRMRELAATVRASCIGPRAREVAGLVHSRSADFEAATHWAAARGDLDLALGIVIDLNAMGSQRGWRRAPTWLAELLDDPPDPAPTAWPDFLAASAATALNEQGALNRARGLAESALRLEADNPQALLVLAHLARRPGECYALATRLLESGTERGDLNWRFDGLSYQAFGLLVDGDYEETLRVARQLGVEGDACGDLSTVGWSRYFTARALSPSDPARALVVLEEAREIADETANPTLEISTRRQSVATLIAGDDPRSALQSLGRLVHRTLELGETDQALRTCALAGVALALLGRDAEAARVIGRLRLPIRTRDDLVAYRRIESDLAARLGDRYDELRAEWTGLPAARTIELVLSLVS